MAICKTLMDLGASKCGFPMKVARRLVFVPLVDDTGAKNRLTLANVKLLVTWTARFDDPDGSKRFYVAPNMENVEDVRADTEFFEWNSGQKARIRQGTRTFTGAIPNETPALLGNLQSFEGSSVGVYIFDTAGNVIFNYEKDSTGEYASPIPIDGNSFDAKYIKSTYSDPLQIMVQFDYSQDVNDKDLYLVPLDELDFDGRTSDFYALLKVYSDNEVWAKATANTFTVDLMLDYNVAAAGFLIGDFELNGAAVTDLSVAETPDGHYVFTAGTTDVLADGDIISLNASGYSPWKSQAAAGLV